MLHFLKVGLKNNSTILTLFVSIIFIIFINLGIIPMLSSFYSLGNVLAKNDCKAIGITTNYNYKDNVYAFYSQDLNVSKYYKNGNLSSLLNPIILQELHDVKYTTTSYVNKDTIIKGHFSKLGEDEVAISNNLYKNFNLNLDDKLFMRDNTGQVKSLKIKYIYEEVYSFFNIDLNNAIPSVILNSEIKIGKNDDMEYIHFFNKNDFMYKEIFYKSDTIYYCNLNFLIFLGLLVILNLFVQLISYFIIMKSIIQKMIRYWFYGVPRKIYFYGLCFVFIITLPFIIINMLIFAWYEMLNFIYIILLIALMIYLIYSIQCFRIMRK